MDELPFNRLALLIVENDRVTARDLEAILRRRGFVVLGIAYSAAQALDIVQKTKPDLALLDIQIDAPEDGIDLAGRLLSDYGISSIFVTGHSEEEVLERARSVDPAAILKKPFSDTEISACLEAVVEHKAVRERLSLRLPVLEAVSQQLPQAVIATDLDGKIVYLNNAAIALTAWSREDALGKALPQVAPLQENSSDGDDGSTTEKRRSTLTTREGEKVTVEERSVPIRTSDGEAVGLVTVLAPPRISVDSALVDMPVDSDGSKGCDDSVDSVDSVDSGDSDGVVSSTDAVDTTVADPVIFPPAQPPVARSEAVRKIASLSQDPAFRDLIVKKKSKPAPKSTPVPSTPSPTIYPTPAPETLSAAAGSAGGALLPQSIALQIEEVGDPLIRFDEHEIIRYANAEAGRVFAPDRRLVGTRFSEHFDRGELERYDAHFHRPLIDGRRHRFDFHDSVRGMWFEVRAYPSQGGVLLLFTDITATRLENAEQVRQHRLEGLGLLARGFAHDFNNSLTTLTGNISLAREKHPDDVELQEMLEEAQTAAAKATGLVQQLMTFARGGRPIRERTRIPDLIRRVLTEQRLKHPEIRYQYHREDPDLIANVDPAQIRRLLENLVTNSAAAMPDGGVLIVRSSRLRSEEVLKIRSTHTPAEEDHLLVEVIDTGHGMSDSDLDRVFEPYFTTHRENNATGIGLTVCESIAKAHGGFVQLQSKEGKGTIATFCAPLGKRHEESGDDDSILYPNFNLPLNSAPAKENTGDALLVGTRILILEDDAPIRRLMAATLRRAGHEVVETKDGRETIEVYTEALQRGERFHLLICDLTIENGMGGVETMRNLIQIDPEILAIVSSGYSDAPAMSSPAAFGFKAVLPKPYAPTELRAAVYRLLAAYHIIA